MADKTKIDEPLKFIVVGISGVGVNYFVLFITSMLLKWSDALSVALAIFISMTTNYILNRIWTFKSTKPIFFEYLRYLASTLFGAVLQYVITLLAQVYFKSINIYSINLLVLNIDTLFISSTIGIGVGFISNFILSKYFVF